MVDLFGVDLSEEFGTYRRFYNAEEKKMIAILRDLNDPRERVDTPKEYNRHENFGEIGIEGMAERDKVHIDGEDYEHKKLYWFGAHEERMWKSRVPNSPTPAQYYEFLMRYTERKMGKKDPWKTAVDILWDEGEYSAHAVKRINDKLLVFEYVQGLRYDEEKKVYDLPKRQWHDCEMIFDVKGLPKGFVELSELHDTNPDLLKHLFSRYYDAIPDVFKEGRNRALVCFPADDNVWPLQVSKTGPYSLVALNEKAASRSIFYEGDYW